jgi:hypothetical protein
MITFALVISFYALRATTHQIAIDRAPAIFGAMIPARCDDAPQASMIGSWPHSTMPHAPAAPCLKEIAAFPDMFSPFRWRLLAQFSNSYESRQIDLLASDADTTAPRTSVRYPNQWSEPVMTAATGHVGQIFLGFSRFPAARSVRQPDDRTLVRWVDLRFVASSLASGQRGSSFFTASADVSTDGRILSEQLGDPSTR